MCFRAASNSSITMQVLRVRSASCAMSLYTLEIKAKILLLGHNYCNLDLITDIMHTYSGLLRGCEAIRVINWDEFLFFLFFFVMVDANRNASCYWLHVHCSQWQLLLFFPSGIKIAFVAI